MRAGLSIMLLAYPVSIGHRWLACTATAFVWIPHHRFRPHRTRHAEPIAELTLAYRPHLGLDG